MGQVRDQVLDHVHVRQRVDRHLGLAAITDGLGAGQGVGAVDVHRARTADALAAGAAESQGRVDLVLDVDQGVQQHRPVIVGRHLIDVPARGGVHFGIIAIDLVGLDVLGAGRGLVDLAGRGLGAAREGELNHLSALP